jgi:hypothetical protein
VADRVWAGVEVLLGPQWSWLQALALLLTNKLLAVLSWPPFLSPSLPFFSTGFELRPLLARHVLYHLSRALSFCFLVCF